MADCNNNVLKQLVSCSLVLELTRQPTPSLCVIYEVFECVCVCVLFCFLCRGATVQDGYSEVSSG